MTTLGQTLLKPDRNYKIFSADRIGALDLSPRRGSDGVEKGTGVLRVDARERPLGDQGIAIRVETLPRLFGIEKQSGAIRSRVHGSLVEFGVDQPRKTIQDALAYVWNRSRQIDQMANALRVTTHCLGHHGTAIAVTTEHDVAGAAFEDASHRVRVLGQRAQRRAAVPVTRQVEAHDANALGHEAGFDVLPAPGSMKRTVNQNDRGLRAQSTLPFCERRAGCLLTP